MCSVPMNQWVFTEVFGALLLVDDRELKSLYFKLFDLDKFELRFQHGTFLGAKLFRFPRVVGTLLSLRHLSLTTYA